jgi:signal transduction histidine kinase
MRFPLRKYLPAALLLAAVATLLTEQLHARFVESRWDTEMERALGASLGEVAARFNRLSGDLSRLAAGAAALPDASPALQGERVGLPRLFQSLQTLAPEGDGVPALAIRALTGAPVAWTERTSEIRGFPAPSTTRPSLFVLAGSVTTTLVAAAPVRGAKGEVLGLGTAELPVKVRRNIHNEYLRDLDRLAGGDPDVEISYRDVRDEAPDPFPPHDPEARTRQATLKAPDGSLLAAVRVSSPRRAEVLEQLADRYRGAAAGLALAAMLAWTLLSPQHGRLRLGVGAIALRLVPVVLTWPVPTDSPLLSPSLYSSPLLFPLLATPLDLLGTSLLALALAAILMDWALRTAPAPPRPLRALLAAILAVLVAASVFAAVAHVAATSALDLDSIALLPRSAGHAVIHLALLALLATALLVSSALVVWSGPLPTGLGARLVYLAAGLAVAAGAFFFRPSEIPAPPPIPALALLAAAALAGWAPARWRDELRATTPESRAGLVIGGVACLALLLFPTLAHFEEADTRREIEREDATLLLGQGPRRARALASTQAAIDRMNLLEEAPPGPAQAGVEELAFSIWSATDLAAWGFSSAVEVHDARGGVISRFALNLPSLAVSGPPASLPEDESWQVSRERLTLASAERDVLHARRRLVYHGEVHGAVHVYLAEDFWNLPFLPARDPYSTLFRPLPTEGGRTRTVDLFVYDAAGRLLFSSGERAPALPRELLTRVRREPAGFWTTLPLEGRGQSASAFVFGDGARVYGLAYPGRSTSRYLADLVEALAGLSLLAVLGVLAVVVLRTALRRPTLSVPSLYDGVRRRFSYRLFVAFIAVAAIPVAVAELVVRRFVAERLHRESEDQARDRAAVAKKAVEDFAFFQRGESPGQQLVTDAALVWAASLIRNDLDLFDRGHLLASSKRELYASGLLLPRVSGAVYRALVLDQRPSALQRERIGSLSTLVVSVPVRLGGPEPGLLSIPLALRQREEEAALEELDRTIRLGTVAFLVLAALLGQSMARRIADPLRDLTRATRQVAAGDLETRVQTGSRDELRGLVDSFNQMASDLERQRKDLERSNRLAAWAEMARQVAHEVKNPLTPIQLSAEHLQRVFGDPGVDFAKTLDTCTDTILKQVRILRRIVTEFSAFARPPAAPPETHDLGEIVREAVAPYRKVLPPGVDLGLDLPAGLPLVTADRRLLERAILNLVENALQAVGERGMVRVRTRAVDGRLELEVEDSGPGLSPEARERIFEPFFSTKTGGSGLGLALVKKTAQDHGGDVWLDSPPGGHTRAILWLPARGSEAKRALVLQRPVT